MSLFFLLGIVVTILVFGVVIFVFRQRIFKDGSNQSQQDLFARMDIMDRRVAEQMHQFSTSFIHQLGNLQHTIDNRLQDNTTRLDQRLDGATRSFVEVRRALEEVGPRQPSSREDEAVEGGAISFCRPCFAHRPTVRRCSSIYPASAF